MAERTFVLASGDARARPAEVGEPGAAMTRLAEAGLPVPAGFHVTAEAYREFVEHNGLRGPIMSAAGRVDPDRPGTAEDAARHIAELFERHDPPTPVASPIRWAYADLGERDHPVAVRPSSLAEDVPPHQAATGVRGESALLAAIRRCWASLWSAPAIEFRLRNGIPHDEAATAVHVQSLVAADAAGTMSTSGAGRGRITLHGAWGLGDEVAAGRGTPDVMVVERGTGHVVDRRTVRKHTMIVLSGEAGGGTREAPVPERWRDVPVLRDDQAAALARLAERIETLHGGPVEVEWAMHNGNPYILQARAVDGPDGRRATDTAQVWNDSLSGDYLWTCGGPGESVPDVMTPCTWSLVQMYLHESMPALSALPDMRAYGIIGGRLYTNLSVITALARAAGKGMPVPKLEEHFGRLPADVEIPRAPVSRARAVRRLLPVMAKSERRARTLRGRFPDFLASSPGRCEALRDRIRAESDPGSLLRLWGHAVLPFFVEACHMVDAANRRGGASPVEPHRDLAKLMGETDAEAMLSGLRKPGGRTLATIGPLTALAHVAEGDLDHSAYLREWGHRGPHEFEVSAPRPDEDPGLTPDAGPMAAERLRARREAGRAAWRRFRAEHPDKVAATRRRVGRWARALHEREAARSEAMRVYAVIRTFVLRAGDLTGHGDDLFFLTIDELLGVLDGDTRSLDRVPARRRAYERYRALAPYPAVIRGRFDPVGYTGEEHRAGEGPLSGSPGAAGVAEGTVRVLDSPERGGELEQREVLVTSIADIGWAPLFPRAAAVVTDVGGPLSDAATVARELAVPAVLGCGDATQRLSTGDHVRVDATRGTVHVISAPAGIPLEPQLTTEG